MNTYNVDNPENNVLGGCYCGSLNHDSISIEQKILIFWHHLTGPVVMLKRYLKCRTDEA